MNSYISKLTLLSLFTALSIAGTGTFTIVENMQTETRINFILGDFQTVDIDGKLRVMAPESGTTLEQGKPELPMFTTLFYMQPGISYEAAFEVLNSSILSDVDIYPFQDASREKSETDINYRDDAFYNSTVQFPETNLQIGDIAIMRGIELMPISLVPFRYHTKTRELEIFHEVEIHIYESGTRAATQANAMPPSRAFEPLYMDLIVNYEPAARDEDYQTPAILYICGGNSDTHPGFLQLADWRHKRGFVVYIASTSETGSSNNQIKNYIQDAYDNFDPPPEFVGLVGDVGGSFDIPNWSMEGGDSDHPYTQLYGNDLLPEVFVGRLSVTGGTELNVVINKSLHYEKATYLENNWLERAALVGDPAHSGLSAVITNEYIENIMVNWGMEEVLTQFTTPFDSWMQTQLNEGLAYFNYRGYLGMSGFGQGEIDNANNGYMTPFVTFITCGTGSFGGTAISEIFIRAGTVNAPKGGVACIGTATLSTHTAPNNIVDMGFYDGIFADGVETGAAALFAGKLALYNTYPSNPASITSKFTAWNNLMGDPALHLWTDTPVLMEAEFMDEIGTGSNYFSVYVSDPDGNPVDRAIVTAVSSNDDIFVSVYSGADGIARVPLNPDFTGDIDVTVTKRNHRPVEGETTVVDDGPVVNMLQDGVLIDDSDGNNNGLLNPGEMAEISIVLQNFGSETAFDLTAVLQVGSVLITVLTDEFSVGELGVGETVAAFFEVDVDPSIIDLEEIDMLLQITDLTGNFWSSIVPVEVHAGKLLFDGYTVTSGYLTHGNTAQLSVELYNAGSVDLTNVTADLIYVPALLEISNAQLSWGDIPAGTGAVSTTSFMVEASADIINGSIFPVEMHLNSDEGYNRLEYLPLQIGEVSVYEPLGPDPYGYYIYDSEDLGYNLSLPYDWYEIDPDFGGPGTSLNMDDDGDGHPVSQLSAHISIPFTFTFYGVDYDEITVSTNGWIGFGFSQMESFRNYQLPGAGGPSPMLAVFWDDLTTNSGGQVYKYIDEDEGIVVIEWSEMRTYDENSVETFQAILIDSVTPTGDDEILLQYKEFNNTTDGNYQSYTPMHGCYSTIGIENHLGNMGLQYTFDDIYPLAAMELSDETALFITTQQPLALLMGDVDQDGMVSITDIVLTVNHFLNMPSDNFGPLERYLADMNQDSLVNILDIILMINAILNA